MELTASVSDSPLAATQEMEETLRNSINRNDKAEIERLLQVLIENPSNHISSIIALAEDETIPTHHRATFMRIMGRLRDAASLHSLVSLSKTLKDHELRAQVIKCLGARPEHEAENRLQELSSDSSDPAQNMAVSFLGINKTDESKELLNRNIQSDKASEEIKNASLYAIRHYRDTVTVTTLLKTANDLSASARLRATAIYSLGSIGNVEALPTIKKNLESPDRAVRYSAVLASIRVSDEQISKTLVNSLCDTSNYPHVRKAASLSLARNAAVADLAILRCEVPKTDGFGIRLACDVFASKKDAEALPILEALLKSASAPNVLDKINSTIHNLNPQN